MRQTCAWLAGMGELECANCLSSRNNTAVLAGVTICAVALVLHAPPMAVKLNEVSRFIFSSANAHRLWSRSTNL